MRKEIINKIFTGVMVATMALTALAPIPTYAAEACKHLNVRAVYTKDTTCTENGMYNRVCENCGKTLEENVIAPAWGHEFTDIELKDGKLAKFHCTNCDEVQNFIPEVDESKCTHDESKQKLYDNFSATCDEGGYTGDLVCMQCGKVLEAGKTIPATGHNWEETYYAKPTCTTDGKKIYTCMDCDEEKEEVIKATGHKWDEGKITLAPTTTKEGTKEYTCQTCVEKRVETLVKLPTVDDSKNNSKGNITTETPKNNNTKSSTATTALVKKRTKVMVGGNTYTVIKAGSKVCFSKAKANIKSLTIPSTIKANGIVYKVTGISSKAVKNNKKIKKVVIGSNVKTIKSKAFYNCPKLRKVTVKNSKLKKKAIKKGFSKVNKKLVIKIAK